MALQPETPLNILIYDAEISSQTTVALNVGQRSLVRDICRIIFQENSSLLLSKNAAFTADDFAIFLRLRKGEKKGHWLNPERPLEYYDFVRQQAVLEYRRKIGAVKVRLLDKSFKTFHVDQTLPAEDVLDVICNRLGIPDPEEFDLVRNDGELVGDQVDGTATMSKKYGLFSLSNINPLKYPTMVREKDIERMQKLRQKVATDDNIVWVNQSQTLLDQGIEDGDILLLKRRYFYSDQNVDGRDPVQLNLLYIQCRNGILTGTHPVTLSEAFVFAGLQGHIEYGAFSDAKRSVDVRSLLPKNYVIKKMDKKELADMQGRVFVEWRNYSSVTEMEAKNQYIKRARSLRTYGVTFFLVKEKPKGKNKLMPRLFGVNKSNVMRLDEKTKEILKFWPITSIKRWKTTDNTFSLDFGDYEDEPYSIQTQEGRQIAQLISGYVELIRKRQHGPLDSDEASSADTISSTSRSMTPAFEDIPPSERKQIGQFEALPSPAIAESGQVALPGVLRNTLIDQKGLEYIRVAQSRVAQIMAGLSAPSQSTQANIAEHGILPRRSRHEIQESDHGKTAYAQLSTCMGNVSASSAQLVNIQHSHANYTDRHQKSIDELINNLEELARTLKTVCNDLPEEQSSKVLARAKHLCQSITDLLEAADSHDHITAGGAEARQDVIAAASKVSESGYLLKESIAPPNSGQSSGATAATITHNVRGDLFTPFVKEIGTKVTLLVRKAKKIASGSCSPTHHAAVIHHATELALQCANVVTCVKLLRMCSDTEENASKETRKQVSVAVDALHVALKTLQSICQEDSQNIEEGDIQQDLFQLDELIIDLDDVIEKFKNELDCEGKSQESERQKNEAVVNALFVLNAQMRQLEEAASTINSTDSSSDPEPKHNLESFFYESLMQKTSVLHHWLCNHDKLCLSASPNSGSQLDKVMALLEELMEETVGASKASEWKTEEEKLTVLNHLKTVYENAYHFISLSTTSTSVAEQESLNAKEGLLEALDEFMTVLQSFHEHKQILALTESDISHSLLRVDTATEGSQEHRITERKGRVMEALRQLDMVTESLSDMEDVLKNIHPDTCYHPQRLREFAGHLCAAFRTTCDGWAEYYELDSGLIDDGTMRKIHKGLLDLGYSNTELIKTSAASATRLDDTAFPAACRHVLQKISYLKLYLNTLNCGTQSCGRALSTIEEVTEDLDTAISFATVGIDDLSTSSSSSASSPLPRTPTTPTTPPRSSSLRFSNPPFAVPTRPKLPTFVSMTDKADRLQRSFQGFIRLSSQQELATTVEESLAAVVGLVEHVRANTGHLSSNNSDVQVIVLRALKAAAISVADVIQLAKAEFSQVDITDEAVLKYTEKLRISVEHSTVRINLLVELVSHVEGGQRGLKMLEVALRDLQLSSRRWSTGNEKEHVSEDTEGLTIRKYRILVRHMDQVRLRIGDYHSVTEEKRDDCLLQLANKLSEVSMYLQTDKVELGHNAQFATVFNSLMEAIQEILQTDSSRQTAVSSSGKFNALCTAMEQAKLSLSQHEAAPELILPLWIAPIPPPQSDQQSTDNEVEIPTSSMTDHLQEAAAQIEKASRRLSKVQARRTIYIPPEEDLSVSEKPFEFDLHDPVAEFDENILEACRAIMQASAALIPAARDAQEELVRHGRVGENVSLYSDDGQWSQGFISAARSIAAACQTLCDATNSLMSGHATEEKLISAARQVASFTAQLLMVCRVKGQGNSKAMQRLLVAGNNVRKTTTNLVDLFKHRRENSVGSTTEGAVMRTPDVVVNSKLVGGIAQEVKANELVSKKEKELVDAQKALLQARKLKYTERQSGKGRNTSEELAAQEMVLVKERELEEARNKLLALRQLKYGLVSTPEEYMGYGSPSSTLPRNRLERPLVFPSPLE
ncbi:hypothetical protein RvY_11131 [Ramazzottius varieornatus]|uniref:FERM domain-containing protein n=1 Tax=Ramazzottius varieornatus TaxID=947166 RepID=A0A1D1VMW8_RAMVA|nr:hypothetical protein RvY_11131 [Ramazzottius varieornatus]